MSNLYVTKQWAIVYSLLCRTNSLENEFTNKILKCPPSKDGFRNFMREMKRYLSLETDIEKKIINSVDPSLIDDRFFEIWFKQMFLDLKRIRMSNKFHSRLNTSLPGSEGFVPVEGWATVKLLNLPGVFNMNNLVWETSAKDLIALGEFLQLPNRIMIDNGAFNRAFAFNDFKLINELYGDIASSVKGLNYVTQAYSREQAMMFRTSLYQKITLVGPDVKQSAPGTLRLIKAFAKELRARVAGTDIMFAVQIDQDESMMDRLIREISIFNEKTIIGLACSMPKLVEFHESAIPVIITKCEEHMNSLMTNDNFKESMGSMLEYTGCPKNMVSKYSGKVIRFHLLGKAFGMTYQNILLNICVASVLVKALGMKCLRYSKDHLEIVVNRLSYEERVLFIGKEYHPELMRHLVSADSSSWVTATSKMYCPITGRQRELKGRTEMRDAKNKSFKINASIIASKLAESMYYSCLPDPKVGVDLQTKSFSDHRQRFLNEMSLIDRDVTGERQSDIREKVRQALLETGNWR